MLHKICFSLLIIILIGCDLKFSGSEDMVFEEIGKAIRKRNFKDNLLVELGRFEYDQKAFLIQTFENRLLLIYNQQNQVLILDENLNPIDQKIKAGDGPLEHVGIKRLFFFEDLSYLTFDHSQQLIRVFDRADSLINFIKSSKVNGFTIWSILNRINFSLHFPVMTILALLSLIVAKMILPMHIK